jgi:hypothetical protein
MEEQITLGLTEKITVLGNNNQEEIVIARIDTGATSSSIDLNLASKLQLGPITKTKVVKSASGIKKRPFIKVRIKLNEQIIEEEFTLADRSHMTYPVLIGQNILKMGNFLIDPKKEEGEK